LSSRPDAMLEWVAKGTAIFEAQVCRVTDPGLAEPSYLMGWSRAHVAAHLARNADALLNLHRGGTGRLDQPSLFGAGRRAARPGASTRLEHAGEPRPS
jgi:maleylpyruvate isomerase